MTEVILITGASRGIGAATALMAAQRGYAVCVNYRSSEAEAVQVVARIAASGGVAVAMQADTSVESEVVAMFDRTASQLGTITALVNNAGILEQQMRLESMTTERIVRVLMTNVVGAMLCAREAVRRMSTKHGHGGGAIVNVSSRAAQLGAPGEYIDYAASKAAIDTLTVGLAKEVGAEGIRVNAVRPGLIYTGMHASGGEPGRIARLTPSVPMQRGGDPEEVASAILWLLSDAASYINGALLDVSGGR